MVVAIISLTLKYRVKLYFKYLRAFSFTQSNSIELIFYNKISIRVHVRSPERRRGEIEIEIEENKIIERETTESNWGKENY